MAKKVVKKSTKKKAAKKRSTRKPATVEIDELVFDAANARRHPERNQKATADSLAQFGAGRSIVVDADNVIRAGNGTAKVAQELGLKARIIESDGKELIVVKRTDLSGSKAVGYAIADNRSGELAKWDHDVLNQQLESLRVEGFDIAELGFDEHDLVSLASNFEQDPEEETELVEFEAKVDQAEELQQQWETEEGQIWSIEGNRKHRLMCGDSTIQRNVNRLLGKTIPFIMVTDPPYGVEYDPEWRERYDGVEGRSTGKVSNDDKFDWTPAYVLFGGSVAYVWHADKYSSDVAANLEHANVEIRAQIIWKKQHFVFSRGHYHWQHEPCWYAVRKGSAKWKGGRKQSTVWEIPNANATESSDETKTIHGTQKPIECMARPIRNHGDADDAVYDPFLGSGTTMLAAEQLKRQCFGFELDPAYCAVILQRMTDAGCKCKLLKK